MANFHIDVNIYFELAAAFFDLLLLGYLIVLRREDIKARRFCMFTCSVLVADLMDVISVASIQGIGILPLRMILFLNEMGYVASAVMAVCFCYYVDSCIEKEPPRGVFQYTNGFLVDLIILQMVGNVFTEHAMWVNPQTREIEYGPLFFITGFALTFIVLYSAIRIIRHRNVLSRKQLAIFLVLYVLTLLGLLFQPFYETTMPVVMLFVSIGVYGIFFSLESPDYKSLVRILEDLDRAEKEADEASKTKSQFLANMSHEIRTPLNAMLGMNDLILEQAGESDVLAYAEGMKKSGENLLNVVNDILDYSKLESGDFEPVYSAFSLSGLTDELTRMYRPMASEKQISFYVNVDRSLNDRLYGDRESIRRILGSLIDNAVKYTSNGYVTFGTRKATPDEIRALYMLEISDPEGKGKTYISDKILEENNWEITSDDEDEEDDQPLKGPITTLQDFIHKLRNKSSEMDVQKASNEVTKDIEDERRSHMKTEFLTFEIADTGQGISEEDIPLMFDSFQRIAVQGIGAISGSGLGLTIANSLASAIRAKIFVNSKVGIGTTFSVVFMIHSIGNTKVDWVDTYRRKKKEETVTYPEQGNRLLAGTGGKPERKLQALVVDDNSMNLKVAKSIIGPLVALCDTASSGEEGLYMMRNKEYDFIFLDHQMPEMDGSETLEKARQIPHVKKPTYILVTAETADVSRRIVHESGFDGFIEKPISRAEVEKVLKKSGG